MEKAYDHQKFESDIYSLWEKQSLFAPSAKGTPYVILMPPPNANASLHAGHAMYTVDDILIRYKRMKGFASEWIPGTDHAGFETQFVYEKHLAKEGKSRLDFDRQTLFDNIYQFVKDNSGLIFSQMKKLGFLANWERSVFTLDKHVIKQVFETFKRMEEEGKVYRDSYIVNYCVHCGTSLAELEVKHVERTDPLFFVRYPLAEDKNKFVVVATVRPEPIFADTHLAVNPKDKKNKCLIGKKVLNPLTDQLMEIIADEYVDPEFGTGVVKLTPAHDANDFEVAKKYNLPLNQAIDWTGKITQSGGKYKGLKVKVAREQVVSDLGEKGLIEKIDTNYLHSVITCYKCGRDLEPLTLPNWFIKVADLKKPVIAAINKNKITFYPKKYKGHILSWLKIMHDWPISRQVVWGIQIPVWYSIDKNPDTFVVFIKNGEKISGKASELLDSYSIEDIEKGIQVVKAPKDAEYVVSEKKPGDRYLQETDTFDTWFSSGQWPIVTLEEKEFSKKYPTDLMATYADILKFWVSRMIMFGLYLKNEIPFKNVYLWSMVADKQGQKMSKSKGNVVNPLEFVEKYGADALRMSLIYGIPAGSKVILSEDKVRGMRNFSNKIWNVARFIQMSSPSPTFEGKELKLDKTHPKDHELIAKLNDLTKDVNHYIDTYQLNKALEDIYEFIWHYIADKYIEENKERIQSKDTSAINTLTYAFRTSLMLLHPFAPFVTEAIWQQMGNTSCLLQQTFPE